MALQRWFLAGGLIASALSLAAGGATQGISGPSVGYFYDATARSLTPVLGIPGASVRGDAIPLPDGVSRVYLAPGQDFGLATLDDGSTSFLDLRSGAAAVGKLDQALANVDAVAFSPSGGAALLYSKADGRLQTVSGLATTPAVARETLALQATALAISDDAQWVVFGNSSGLWTVDSAGSLGQVAGLTGIRALAFRAGSAAVAVSAGSSLYLISDLGAATNAALLGDNLAEVSALAISADGSFLFARTGLGVTVLRTNDGSMTAVTCDCEVTAFEALKSRNVFRLSVTGTGPTYLFDGSGATPRVVFVPGQAPAAADLTVGGAQ